jgi:GDP-L-fucose synthase
VGFEGQIIFDVTKPDGTPRKLMDVSKLTKLGWSASIKLEDGLSEALKCFLVTINN